MSSQETPTCDLSREEFESLVSAANSGDENALNDLRDVLRRNPEIWQAVGNLGKHAERALLNALSEGNSLVRESLQNKCEELLEELSGPQPSTLSRMVAHRVVVAWLELQYADLKHPQPTGDLTHARFQLQLKRNAQTRFDRAVRTWKLLAGQKHSQNLHDTLRVVG